MTPALQVTDLRVTFTTPRGPVRAVSGVSLMVEAGQSVGLVGESGSGKSVTLRAIARLLRPNADVTGRVLWGGQELLTASEPTLRGIRGPGIAMIFQEPTAALDPVLTIGRQIDESLVAHTTLDRRARRGRALELLDRVGITGGAPRLDSYPHEFSGGMKQRAMIAIAIASAPKLLLADEPTTALDVTIQAQVLALLRRLSQESGMAMVLVTHDLGVVAEACQTVNVMYAGRVVEAGPVQTVFTRPHHAYTAALLRSMPGTGTPGEQLATISGQPPSLLAPIAGCAFAPRCGFVMERCRVELPPFLPIGAGVGAGHAAACWASAQVAP